MKKISYFIAIIFFLLIPLDVHAYPSAIDSASDAIVGDNIIRSIIKGNSEVIRGYHDNNLIYVAKVPVHLHIDTGRVINQKIPYGENIADYIVKEPEKEGYVFVGWKSSDAPNMEVITSGDGHFVGDGISDYYAVFKKQITIKTVNDANAQEIHSFVLYNNGNVANPSLKINSTHKKNGWTLIGYRNDMTASTDVDYFNGFSYEFSESKTIYAVFQRTVTVNCISDSDVRKNTGIQVYNNGSSTKAKIRLANNSSQKDWKLTGYRNDKSAAQATYTPNSTYEFSEDTDIFAVFSRNISVNYVTGASAIPSSVGEQLYNNGNMHNPTLKIVAASKNGSTFIGYRSDKTATSKVEYVANNSYTFNGNISLYAIYKTSKKLSAKKEVKMTTVGNGGTITPENGTASVMTYWTYDEISNAGSNTAVKENSKKPTEKLVGHWTFSGNRSGYTLNGVTGSSGTDYNGLNGAYTENVNYDSPAQRTVTYSAVWKQDAVDPIQTITNNMIKYLLNTHNIPNASEKQRVRDQANALTGYAIGESGDVLYYYKHNDPQAYVNSVGTEIMVDGTWYNSNTPTGSAYLNAANSNKSNIVVHGPTITIMPHQSITVGYNLSFGSDTGHSGTQHVYLYNESNNAVYNGGHFVTLGAHDNKGAFTHTNTSDVPQTVRIYVDGDISYTETQGYTTYFCITKNPSDWNIIF